MGQKKWSRSWLRIEKAIGFWKAEGFNPRLQSMKNIWPINTQEPVVDVLVVAAVDGGGECRCGVSMQSTRQRYGGRKGGVCRNSRISHG